METWPRGRRHSPAKGACGLKLASRVRIPPSPPDLLKSHIFKSIQRLRKYGFFLIYHIELPLPSFLWGNGCLKAGNSPHSQSLWSLHQPLAPSRWSLPADDLIGTVCVPASYRSQGSMARASLCWVSRPLDTFHSLKLVRSLREVEPRVPLGFHAPAVHSRCSI